MTARFRLVHFLADPFTGARFPIAALVEANNRVQLAKAPEGQAAAFGLSRQASTRASVRFALESLSEATTFDSLPPSVGPHVLLGEPREIPAGGSESIKWVQRTFLSATPPRGPRAWDLKQDRETLGYRFLEQWQVAKWVGRKFRPDYLGPFSLLLPEVSQYVRGESRLLLMEPIVASRESTLFKTLRKIGTSFMAWQHGFEKVPHPKTEFLAYVVSAEEPEMVAEARRVLGVSGTTVLDVSATGERVELFEKIRTTAMAA